MTFDNLVTKLIEDSTSKAPKGDSYDSQNNWKPSGVASYSDGPGGRYRRTRPNKPGRSKATHGGRGVQDEEDVDTVEITLPKDLADVLHDLLMSVAEAEDEELQEEALGTIARGAGRLAAGAGKLAGKAALKTGKMGAKLAGKAALKAGKVGLGAATGAVAGAIGGAGAALISDEEGEDDNPSEGDVLDDYYNERELERMKKDPEEDAEYRGRKVSLNKPTRGDVKKFKVYVKDPKTGNVKKVNFGHGGTSAKRKGEKTMKIRKSNPKARKSFRARHNCDNPGPKTKARYWSCRKW
tara:strand:+ start:102 stop:989 length:888 start_codon:yes stop_codon:yes gene_type:complete